MSWNRVSYRLIMENSKTIQYVWCVSLFIDLTYLLCDRTLGFVCVLMKWPLRTACLIVLWGLSHFWLLSSLSILVIKSFFLIHYILKFQSSSSFHYLGIWIYLALFRSIAHLIWNYCYCFVLIRVLSNKWTELTKPWSCVN